MPFFLLVTIEIKTQLKLRQSSLCECPRTLHMNHPARQVKKKDYALFDLILVMDPNNQRNIKRILPQNPEHKIHLLLDNESIADPWYTGDFEKSYEQIRQGCEIWLERLENSFV